MSFTGTQCKCCFERNASVPAERGCVCKTSRSKVPIAVGTGGAPHTPACGAEAHPAQPMPVPSSRQRPALRPAITEALPLDGSMGAIAKSASVILLFPTKFRRNAHAKIKRGLRLRRRRGNAALPWWYSVGRCCRGALIFPPFNAPSFPG